MKRRDFILLRARAEQPRPLRSESDAEAELSCERLFMRFVDAEADGTTDRLFEILESDLRKASSVRLTETSWLAREDLRSRLDGVLESFTARGGEITRCP